MLEIVFEKEENRAAAYADGKLAGVCQFEISGETWTITHTEVDPAYSGQGIAGRLVNAVADAAKSERVTLTASCSYARKVLNL